MTHYRNNNRKKIKNRTKATKKSPKNPKPNQSFCKDPTNLYAICTRLGTVKANKKVSVNNNVRRREEPMSPTPSLYPKTFCTQ